MDIVLLSIFEQPLGFLNNTINSKLREKSVDLAHPIFAYTKSQQIIIYESHQ